MKKPLLLMILDGYGHSDSDIGNAVKSAHTPNLDKYFKENPSTYIAASGLAVGLPDGQIGNSEVGHTNIGAGRVIYQNLVRITKSIQQDEDFFVNEKILGATNHCKENNSSLHIIGLLSNGGVHSHIDHINAMLEFAKNQEIEKVYVHCFMDGRDVSPTSGVNFLKALQTKITQVGVGSIATISGRYYAMDRDNCWDRVEKAYNAMTLGQGEKANDVVSYVKDLYKNNTTDEFILPTVIDQNGLIKSNDSVVFVNFRPDRARQITRAFVDNDFKGFERKALENLYFVCMTQYDESMPNVQVAFEPDNLTDTFGEIISKNNLTQLRIAETQKYAHVTFFFNGGKEQEFKGEDRVLIKSPDVATFDLKPEMSAYEVTDAVVDSINSDKYDVIILNYANPDMVGHTGVFDATVKAIEAVDSCVGKTVEAVLAKGGVCIITADHGNAEKMLDTDGSPFTPHTINEVPLAIVGYDCKLRDFGKLADIAPTMCEILGLDKPEAMTGESLIFE